MVDALNDVTVLARGGLYTNEDVLSLAATNPGAATRMLNFEISQFGGYRRVGGYKAYDSSYTTVTGSASVIGSQRTISFNLNTGGDAGQDATEVVTGLKYITGAGCTNSESIGEDFLVQLNTPSNGSATVDGVQTTSTGVLTVFGYGGG